MFGDDRGRTDIGHCRSAGFGALRLGDHRPPGGAKDIIAATMLGLGTSLPELMTAVATVRKGHPEITVGNVVGANVLNCLFVTGAAASARPLAITENFFYFHFPTMLIVLYSFGVFISINRDGWFKKWQGIELLSVYAVYVIAQYAMNIGTVVK